MFTYLNSLRKKKRLLKDFVVRDLKARYVGSSMGFFWSVIFPLFNLGIYMFVFRLVLESRFSDTSTPEE
ncbi:MAG: ABC transporter permease, partial [Planctomycetota bacterium]